MSVNWLTTSASPPTSMIERSNLPSSFSKMRRRALLIASASASRSSSSAATPTRIRAPARPPRRVSPSTVTDALLTRWMTTRIRPVSPNLGRRQPESLNQGTRAADTTGMEAARNPWPALGTLLVRDGAVTPEQLEIALLEKRIKPELRLGEILVTNGFATRLQVTRVLAEQHDLDFVELDIAADRGRGSHAPAGGSRPPVRGDPDQDHGRRLRPRRRLRSDERDVLRRPPTRSRDAGARVRRIARRDRVSRSRSSTTAPRSISRTSSRAPRRPRTTRPSST